MSRRSKETLSVQLFPFLAVLVCTMGALIFLLLVTTREIRQRVVAFAAYQEESRKRPSQPAVVEEPPATEVPLPIPEEVIEPVTPAVNRYELALAERERELEQLKAEWRLRVSELESDLERRRNEVAQRKSRLDGTLENAALLEAEIKKLEEQLGELAGEAAAFMLSTDEAERVTLEQQIADLKKQIRAAQVADATDESDRFQVVPFDPQTGTSRRPIFIECCAAGIRFLPEDILITAQDMEGFTTRANPLAAGTGALVNYWSVWNSKQKNPRSEPEPYILLLVRPDGIYSYYVAMRMLEPIRTSHGYELIDQTTALKLPPVEQGAKTACQTAIDRLKEQRESIALSAIGSGAGGTVFGGTGRRASGLGQGFAPESPDSNGGPGTRRSGNGFTMSDVTGGESEVGSRSWERIENFEGRPRGKRRGGGTGSAGTGGGGAGGSFDETPEDYQAMNQPGRGSGRRGSYGGTANPDGEMPQPQSSDFQGSDDSVGDFDGTSSGPGGPGSDATVHAYGTDDTEPGSPTGRPGRLPGRSGSRSSDSVEGDSSAGDGEAHEGGSSQRQASGGSRSQSGDPNSSSMGSDDPSGETQYAHELRPGLRFAKPGEKISRMNKDPNKPLEPEMLSGRRWGLGDPGASIGYEREVRIDVSHDRLVIAEKHVIAINEGDTRQDVFVRFASALDAYAYDWGRPPQGFFWAPRLKFVVKPDGDARYEQINAMMTRAGLSTSHEFANSTKAVEFGRMTPKQAKPIPKTAVFPRSRGNR
ncbi:hypothetical protein [Schlesneria sp. T3-172]|uniref:hypothetical protein n=1 Tax=Schlesneria sphaerica TaxID=3373610 RepID=UPI0037C53321